MQAMLSIVTFLCPPQPPFASPVRSAMLEGDYEIYMVVDASGGTSEDAHKYAMDRMIQAGVVPVTY